MRRTVLVSVSALSLLAIPALAAGQSPGGRSGEMPPEASETPEQSPGGGERPGGVTRVQMRAALEGAGFTEVGEPERVGELYRVEVTNEGQRVTLLIDPVTHEVGIAK